MTKRFINKNFRILVKTYLENKNSLFKNNKIVALEGSSRSGKTISAVDFIIWYCLNNDNKTVFLIRQTYNSHKTTLYLDFHRRLKDMRLPSPFDNAKEVSQFKIGTCTLFFCGADTPSKFEGAGSDLAYFNEFLDIMQVVFDQVEQRNREFIFADWNPKHYSHWVYESILKRDNCVYLHSTYKDNIYISGNELAKILSYEPTEDNIRQGTANKYRWNVYGLGLRCALDEMAFQEVHEIDTIPSHLPYIYGFDIGYNPDPSVVNKVAVDFTNYIIYIDQVIYRTNLNREKINDALISNSVQKRRDKIITDTNNPEMINWFYQQGWNTHNAQKNNRIEQINEMTFYKICITKRSIETLTEFRNYMRLKDKNGVVIDDFQHHADHSIDASRYAFWELYTNKIKNFSVRGGAV